MGALSKLGEKPGFQKGVGNFEFGQIFDALCQRYDYLLREVRYHGKYAFRSRCVCVVPRTFSVKVSDVGESVCVYKCRYSFETCPMLCSRMTR